MAVESRTFAPEAEKTEKIKRASSAAEVYKILLGGEMPKSPENLPDKVELPAGVLGSLEKAMIATKDDDHERNQMITWSNIKKDLKAGILFRGYHLRTGFFGNLDAQIRTSRFAARPLVYFHTHPQVAMPFFSKQDMVLHSSLGSPAFIDMVGSARGNVYALFTTEKFKPFPTYRKSRNELAEKRGLSDFMSERTIRILEEHGYGVYEWMGDVKKGVMKDGITLKRIKSTEH